MATQRPKTKTLYLDQVTLKDVLNRDYTPRLFIEIEELELQTRDNRTWTATKRPGLSPTSEMRAEVRMRSGKFLWAKNRQARGVINLQALLNDYWNSEANEITVPVEITIDGKHDQYRCILELRFSASTTTEAVRSLLHQLERLVEEYSPLMSKSTEKLVGRIIKYGDLLSSRPFPFLVPAFSLASVTFELLKELSKIPSSLLDRLRRLSSFADIVAEEIVCDETGYLGRVVSQMFEVIYRFAKVSCDYVKCSSIEGGQAYLMAIEGMDGELAKVIEEFVRAVDLEALRFAKSGHQGLRARSGQVWEGPLGLKPSGLFWNSLRG